MVPRTALVVVALLAGACASSSPENDTTDPLPVTAAPGTTFDTGLAELDDVLQAAALAQGPCASLDQWTVLLDAATGRLQALAAELHVSTHESWRTGAQASAASDLVIATFTTNHDCQDLAGDTDAAAAAAARAFAAVDTFHLRLTGSDFPKLATRFWLSSDQLGAAIAAEETLLSGSIDVLVVGDSATARGVNPTAVTEATGLVTFNAGADGLLPEMALPTVDELLAVGVDPTTVVLGINATSDFISCADLRPALQENAKARRDTAFAGVAALADLPGERRVHGGESLAYEGPLLDLYLTRRSSAGNGEFVDADTTPDVDRQREVASRTVGVNERCADRPIAAATAVAELEARGLAVVVLFTPVSETIASLLPGGRDDIQRILDDYRDAFAATGATEIDATESLTAAEFFDLTHANDAGRRTIAALVADALAT